MNTATQTTTDLQGDLEPTGKATIYIMGEFGMGYKRLEVKTCQAKRVKYAQYDAAVELRWRKPRQRNDRGTTQTDYANAVILAGWGHAEPDDGYDWSPADANGTKIGRSRHSSCSDGWNTEFAAMLDGYLAANPTAKVLRDYRGMNAYDRYREAV